MSKKPVVDVGAMARRHVEKREEQRQEGSRSGETGHLQVRLYIDDIATLKAHLARRKMSVQDFLAETISARLAEWGEPPIANPGTAGKKS